MRDIRPASGSGMEPRLPSEPPILPKRLPGSTVPVAKSTIPVPPVARRTLPARPPEQAARLGQRERAFAVGLLLLVLVMGALAAVIFLPKAELTLTLRTAPLLVEKPIAISTTSQTDSATPAIPGTVYFRELEVEGNSPVTSTEVIGKKATGTVRLINRAFDEQKIVDKSRLVTKDGILFYTQSSVTIPAASGGSVSQVTVAVEAAEAGEAGNIAAGRLDFAALSKEAQALVYAEAPTALTGGSGETIAVVKEPDLEAARTAAQTTARTTIEADIRSELAEGWSLLDESWSAEIVSFDTPVALEAQESTIPFKARLKMRVFGYETEALEKQLRAALEEEIDEGYMLFPGAISFTTTVDTIDWDTGQATLSARVTHTTIAELSLPTLREKLAGRSDIEARTYVEGLPGVNSATIDLSPFWVKSVPRIQKRISIELIPERQP